MKRFLSVSLATLLFSIALSWVAQTPPGPTNDVALKIRMVQPVQVIYAQAPGYHYIQVPVVRDEYDVRVTLPMIRNKGTRLFGLSGADTPPVGIWIINYNDVARRVRVSFWSDHTRPRAIFTYPEQGSILLPRGEWRGDPPLWFPSVTPLVIAAPIPPVNRDAFTFPAEGEATIRIRLTDELGNVINDVNPANDEHRVRVMVLDTNSLHIRYLRLRVEGDPEIKYQELYDTMRKGAEHSRDIFPFARDRITWSVPGLQFPFVDTITLPKPPTEEIQKIANTARPNMTEDELRRIRSAINQVIGRYWEPKMQLVQDLKLAGGQTVLVGLVKNDRKNTWWNQHFAPYNRRNNRILRFGSPGLAWVGAGVCLVEVGYWTTVAHEIGHAVFGLPHPPLINDRFVSYGYGFRVEGHPPERRVNRWRIPTIMWPSDGDVPCQGRGVSGNSAYMNLDVRWIDREEYRRIMGVLTVKRFIRQGLFIRGSIPRIGGPMTLSPWFRDETVLDVDETTSGSYRLEYLGPDGSTNNTVRFDVSFLMSFDSDAESIELERTAVGFWAPWYPNTVRVRIRNPQGEIIATRGVTPNPPVVRLLHPSVNAIVRPRDLTVRWTSSDPDGDPLTHGLLIRETGREAWNPVVGSTFTTKTEGTIPKEFLEMGKSYQIKIMTSDGLNTSVAEGSFSVSAAAPVTTLVFTIGRPDYTVNEVRHDMDVVPIIREGRTLLPIRFVAEPLGAVVSWDEAARKVTVTMGTNVLELWIGRPVARVNGRDAPIDPANPRVVPIIERGRSFLPLRFIAESLGADVLWDGALSRVTVIHPR